MAAVTAVISLWTTSRLDTGLATRAPPPSYPSACRPYGLWRLLAVTDGRGKPPTPPPTSRHLLGTGRQPMDEGAQRQQQPRASHPPIKCPTAAEDGKEVDDDWNSTSYYQDISPSTGTGRYWEHLYLQSAIGRFSTSLLNRHLLRSSVSAGQPLYFSSISQ